jgi:hypothetical protein
MGVLLLYMGCEWAWEYSRDGYVRVFVKGGHGAYVKNEGLLGILTFGICLVMGLLILGSCLRRLWHYKKRRRLE